jgi:hypothetical protein
LSLIKNLKRKRKQRFLCYYKSRGSLKGFLEGFLVGEMARTRAKGCVCVYLRLGFYFLVSPNIHGINKSLTI